MKRGLLLAVVLSVFLAGCATQPATHFFHGRIAHSRWLSPCNNNSVSVVAFESRGALRSFHGRVVAHYAMMPEWEGYTASEQLIVVKRYLPDDITWNDYKVVDRFWTSSRYPFSTRDFRHVRVGNLRAISNDRHVVRVSTMSFIFGNYQRVYSFYLNGQNRAPARLYVLSPPSDMEMVRTYHIPF